MSGLVVERRRTGWDVVLGALVTIAGIVVLSHAVVATAVSVFLLGWMALFGGLVALVSAFFRLRQGGFWVSALSGALLAVLGLVILRNPLVAVVSLTLVAGSLFLVGGVVRLVAAAGADEQRIALVLSGVVSTALGMLVLLNLAEASLTLLGVLVGVEALTDGVAMMIMGRPRVRRVQPEPPAEPPAAPSDPEPSPVSA